VAPGADAPAGAGTASSNSTARPGVPRWLPVR